MLGDTDRPIANRIRIHNDIHTPSTSLARYQHYQRQPIPSVISRCQLMTFQAIYLMHYAHRAIISPLVLSPKRSPLHPIVASCIASYSYL